MWTMPSSCEGCFPIASEKNLLEWNNNTNSASQQPDVILPHSPINLMSFRPVKGSQKTGRHLKKLNGGSHNCPFTQSNVTVEKTPGVKLALLGVNPLAQVAFTAPPTRTALGRGWSMGTFSDRRKQEEVT